MRQQEALAAVAAQAGTPVAAAAATTLSDSDEDLPRRRRSRAGNEQHGSPASGRRRKSCAAVAPASGRRKSSASAASSSSAAASDEEHDTDVVPAAPALTPAVALPPPPAPFLTNDELLRLALLHLSKVLLQCRDWVPCGTHPLGSMDAEEEGDDKEESKEAEAADATPASSAPAATPAPAFTAAVSTESSAPASSSTASSPSSSCPFGFVVTPALQRGAATRTSDKLKKCELCGLLQIVVGKSAAAAVKHDDAMQAMIESGALRPCPQCTALNMKDYGLCNVLQCHACQIWWNWESRATGSSSQQLKDLARRTGTMWMPGELQYQQKLQREDPAAFKDLLARNGIEYNPNYIRGSR